MFNFSFFLVLLPLAFASIAPDHFAGEYTLHHGTCADKLSILINSTTIPAATIQASNQTCRGDTLTLSKPEAKDAKTALLTFLLSDSVGDFYSSEIQNLTCGNYTFSNQLYILRPEDDITPPKGVLELFATLNQTFPEKAMLSKDYIYIFIDTCIYKRKGPKEIGVIEDIVSSITECFPADAVVYTKHGKLAVKNLVTGTEVLSSHGEYTKVIGWTHRESMPISNFVKISFGNSSITITPGHYVYADNDLIPARYVKEGMVMRGLNGGLLVSSIEYVRKDGLYNPQTGSGDIVVNGVIVSTYTEAVPPLVAHALLAPVRVGFDIFAGVLKGNDHVEGFY